MLKAKFISRIVILFVIIVFNGCTPEVSLPTDTIGQTQVCDSLNRYNETDGPNLLENGGLEEWNNVLYDIPSGWFSHNNGNVRMDYKVVYEGCFSAKMKSLESGSTARIDQCVPVTPGSKIRIRFMYYVEQWQQDGARTYCYFRTGSAENTTIPISELREFYTDEEYYIIRGGGRGLKYLPHTLNHWLEFNETITVPPTATHFVFGVNSYYETTIYVDDCYVGEVTIQ